MQNNKIELVLFDLIGTTVKDSHNGESLIMDCFNKSFNASGFQISYEQLNLQRGRSKKEAIRNILTDLNLNIDLAGKIYAEFIDSLNKSLNCFSAIKGASEMFGKLKEKGIKIGLGSGLPVDFMHRIIKQVGWQPERFDYIGSSEEPGKGRPDPAMIFDAMLKLRISDRSKVLKVGDTVVDIQEGKNAGVLTAGVLTGTQTGSELEKYGPDYIFADINGLLEII